MSERILVVDDEQEIADLVELYLLNENYTVCKFYSADAALRCVDEGGIDLAIIDIMLPDIDGLAICQRIRKRYDFPIIMLTAKDTEMDKITGLTLGADDYVTKPFRPLELVARVKAQLRRYRGRLSGDSMPGDIGPDGAQGSGGSGEAAGHGAGGNSGPGANENMIVHSGLVLDIDSHQAFLDERLLSLTPTEFSILRILLQNRGVVISSERLFYELWGEQGYSKSNNTITVHIRHLRTKMGDSTTDPRYIKTVWGVGYRIDR
ncbi:MAG: response regulator transcription factor [Coriobacteriia bacterium]|nr:response regulator transcription factor [Coriobacteriia bacterium]